MNDSISLQLVLSQPLTLSHMHSLPLPLPL
jgi:hypothetical protein